MGVESYLVLWVFTDECCHPNRFRVELMLIESFEIGRLDFPNRDTLESTHCCCLTTIRRKFSSNNIYPPATTRMNSMRSPSASGRPGHSCRCKARPLCSTKID